MQIAVYSRLGSEKQEQGLLRCIEALRRQAKTLLYAPLYPCLSQKYGLHFAADDLFSSAADISGVACIISVGGDGTMLDAAAMAVQNDIPIAGFCTGRLGFLPILKDSNLEEALNLIINKKFEIERRSMLYVEGCPDGSRIALNDICVQKRGSAVAEINVHIDGEFLSSYWADGLIVATPTGSTAYSLSAGGPIISPQARCFVVTANAAHNLNVRPVIVPDTSVLTIDMRTRSKNIVVSVDSKEYEAADNLRLTVQKHDTAIGFVKLPCTSFYQTLREKLLWGMGGIKNE